MLTQKDIEALERLNISQISRQWEGLLRKSQNNGRITIANTGLYSSGKSSLFNALLGRTGDNDMRFKVGAVPTTKKGDREKFTDNIDLLDTPGIDTRDSHDDAEALDMLL